MFFGFYKTSKIPLQLWQKSRFVFDSGLPNGHLISMVSLFLSFFSYGILSFHMDDDKILES